MTNTKQWSRVGWQGIQLEIPSDWSPGRVEGDRKKGYLRLDDELAVRSEVRWETPRKAGCPFEEIVDNFVAQMRKRAGRKAHLDITRNAKLSGPDGHEWEALRCSGDVKGYWLLSRCQSCGRVVGINLLAPSGKFADSDVAARIFASLTDHADDGLDLWELYDLRFKLPQELPLDKALLKTGSIELDFADRTRQYYVRRLGLAETILVSYAVG